MPGRKRKGSKKGGPGSTMAHDQGLNQYQTNRGSFSNAYSFHETKRIRPKKNTGVKKITQRTKKTK